MLSIFMIVVVAKAIRVGGMRIFRYLLASFALILISDFILILTAFSVFGTIYIDLFIFSLKWRPGFWLIVSRIIDLVSPFAIKISFP